MKKVVIILFLLLTIVFNSKAQSKRAWEFGIGGSVHQFNRIPYVTISSTENEDIIDVKLRSNVYSGGIYVAKELTNVFTWDIQGFAGNIENKLLTQVGMGIQYRFAHYFNSPYIDPYLRVGVDYLYKGYNIKYEDREGDFSWRMWITNNKSGKDVSSVIPISLGGGVNMWLNDRIGLGFQGNYLYIPRNQVANPIQGIARVMFRFGGKTKKPQPVYVNTAPVERERIVEVEKIVERTVEVEKIVNIVELLSSINFDFDSHEVKANYRPIIREVAKILLSDRSKRFLITGFTDSRGAANYNLRLSEQRAVAIMNALVNEGVPQNMLKARGAGMRIANLPQTASESARQGDRKVTIELITNSEYWDQL